MKKYAVIVFSVVFYLLGMGFQRTIDAKKIHDLRKESEGLKMATVSLSASAMDSYRTAKTCVDTLEKLVPR